MPSNSMLFHWKFGYDCILNCDVLGCANLLEYPFILLTMTISIRFLSFWVIIAGVKKHRHFISCGQSNPRTNFSEREVRAFPHFLFLFSPNPTHVGGSSSSRWREEATEIASYQLGFIHLSVFLHCRYSDRCCRLFQEGRHSRADLSGSLLSRTALCIPFPKRM